MRILICEDEKSLNKTLNERLTKLGHCVDSAYDGEESLDFALAGNYDVIVLDVMMPKMSGFDVIKEIRKEEILTPVIFLTARDSDEDIIVGLDNGANDYLAKPFSFDVLCARIRALGRINTNQANNIIEINDLSINTVTKEVKRGGKNIELSAKEYTILECLARNKEAVVSKEQLEEQIWNFDNDAISDVIKVYIHHLRKKIDNDYDVKLIHTIKNLGYVLKEK